MSDEQSSSVRLRSLAVYRRNVKLFFDPSEKSILASIIDNMKTLGFRLVPMTPIMIPYSTERPMLDTLGHPVLKHGKPVMEKVTEYTPHYTDDRLIFEYTL